MNFANRTIWTADNIEILPGIDSECVDLVYLDPPFNSNRNYAASKQGDPAGSHPIPLLRHKTLVDGQPAVYVCRNYVCQLPVTTSTALATQLQSPTP